MAEDIIEDASRLFKKVGNEITDYPTDDPDFFLREKKLMRTPKSYAAFVDIQRYANNLNASLPFNNGRAMLPVCSKASATASSVAIKAKQIYKVKSPGFIYTQRFSSSEYQNGYAVYIDGDADFSEGPKYMATPDGFPDPNREYFIKRSGNYVSAGDPGQLLVFDKNTTYYEKFGKTYFCLYSSNNGGGLISNNMFPICPGANTFIAVFNVTWWTRKPNSNTPQIEETNVMYLPAKGYESGGGLEDQSKALISEPKFNRFDPYNARYIFSR